MSRLSLQLEGVNSLAVGAAASVRDGLRTAQFYARDLAGADRFEGASDHVVPLLSRLVGVAARFVDRFLGACADLSIRLFLPTWRDLPSPFAPGILQQVVQGVHENSLFHNPLFNAYFFRASRHILQHCTKGPYLVLEHRVEAARRRLAAMALPASESKEELLARILIELARQRAVAKAGYSLPRYRYLEGTDPNVAVMAIACIALLFAEVGRPAEIMSEDEFFDVTGALVGPRFGALTDLVAAGDQARLASALLAIKDLY